MSDKSQDNSAGVFTASISTTMIEVGETSDAVHQRFDTSPSENGSEPPGSEENKAVQSTGAICSTLHDDCKAETASPIKNEPTNGVNTVREPMESNTPTVRLQEPVVGLLSSSSSTTSPPTMQTETCLSCTISAEALVDPLAHHSQQDQQPALIHVSAESSEWPHSLVILISSSDSDFFVNQDRVLDVLKEKRIQYRTVNAANGFDKDLSEELLALSNHNEEFPQFFLVNAKEGALSFWGLYERFQGAVSQGTLEEELQPTSVPASLRSSGDCDTNGHVVRGTEVAASQSHSLQASPSPREVPQTGDAIDHDMMLAKLAEQIKRIEQNHQQEVEEIEKRHEHQIEVLQKQLQQALANNNEQDRSGNEQLEKLRQLEAMMIEKDQQLREAMRANEGYHLKMDALKRELAGVQALLAGKDKDRGKMAEENLRNLRALEKKLNEAEDNVEKARRNAAILEETIEATRAELRASNQEQSDLKERTKLIAAELKERRVECRDLSKTVNELSGENKSLREELEKLEYQLSGHDKNQSERHNEIEQLRCRLSEADTKIVQLKKTLEEKDVKNEKAISEYKKKAQSSLALANARTATAVQAKEEAELEARAARNTADAAMEKAMKAELDSKALVKEMATERDEALKQLEELKTSVTIIDDKLRQQQQTLEKVCAAECRKTTELDRILSELTMERTKTLSLQKELVVSNSTVAALRDDLASLREQLRRAEALLRAASTQDADEDEKPLVVTKPSTSSDVTDLANILILQDELHIANRTIDELREALRNAVEVNKMSCRESSSALSLTAAHDPSRMESSGLLYAMEKQAELNTARSEINRLANLLSDAQSEKMEAIESRENMRRKMEEAEARQKRLEKLRPNLAASSGGERSEKVSSAEDCGAVNVEYLKNVMLSYLNAKSLSERKALVPVISAVLCLTPEENKEVISSLENSASIGIMSSSIFESISGSYLQK